MEGTRTVGEQVLAATWRADARGRFIEVDPSFLSWLGIAGSGEDWFERCPDADGVRQRWESGIASGRPFSLMCQVRSGSGELTDALITAKPSGASEWHGVIVPAPNLAKAGDSAQELQQKLEESTAALQAANKELETFTYSVSHDLRGPLRTIMSSSMILIEDYADSLNEEAREELNRQAASAKKLSKLIDDILVISRLGRAEVVREDLDLSALAEEVGADSAQKHGQPGTAVQIEPGIRAHADAKLVRTALQNLFDNAFKFQPGGNQPMISFGKKTDGDRSAFFVRDNGIGLDMANAERVFLPFERLHRESEYPGTGIGLAAVKRIVDKHGGKAWVESQPGEGATIFFTLGEDRA